MNAGSKRSIRKCSIEPTFLRLFRRSCDIGLKGHSYKWPWKGKEQKKKISEEETFSDVVYKIYKNSNRSAKKIYWKRSATLSKSNHSANKVIVKGPRFFCFVAVSATWYDRRLQFLDLGWKFMSCSHCQELGQQASWLLIGCTRVNTTNQKPGQQVDPTLDNDYNSKISATGCSLVFTGRVILS